MSILVKIENDSINALKNKDSITRVILSTLIGEIKMSAKNDGNREATDEDSVRVIRKFLKNAEDNITQKLKIGRPTNSEEFEVLTLRKYLPSEISAEDIQNFIKVTYEGTSLTIRDMGRIMNDLKQKYMGTLNPAVASKVVKEFLSG